MKKFLLTLFAFGILIFLVDKLFYAKLTSLSKREYDKCLELILNGKINQDILIFGSSSAQHDVYSDLLEEELKLKIFNLGHWGANINFQVYLLKKVLKHNNKHFF